MIYGIIVVDLLDISKEEGNGNSYYYSIGILYNNLLVSLLACR